MKKLKVLHVMNTAYGGVARHVLDIISNRLDDNIEYGLVYSNFDGDKNFISRLKSSVSRDNIIALNIHKIPTIGDLFNIFKIYTFIKVNGFDILHCHGAKAGVYGRLIKFASRVNVIYTPHGGSLHDSYGRLQSKLYLCTEKILMRYTDQFLFESHYSKSQFFAKVGPIPQGKYFVNHNGIFENKFFGTPISDLSYKGFNVAMIGSLRPEKGQMFVIQTFNDLLRYEAKLNLHIFGTGAQYSKISDYIIKNKLGGSVYLHGNIENVLHRFNWIDLVIIASTHESFGYVAVEAMQARVPIISTEIGGLAEVISIPPALRFIPNSKYSLISAFRSFKQMNDNEKTRLVIESYNKYLALFQGARMVSAIEIKYKELN